ncbi:hypothetical protein M758_UG094700 [Ceratodon purpureus]|nr:hypothetical protein M758_UG094700 [Ceratodon purpureus]
MLGGGFFTTQFTSELDKLHTLTRQYRIYQQTIQFTTWRADFQPINTLNGDPNIILPIWAQIIGLCKGLRSTELLTEVFANI